MEVNKKKLYYCEEQGEFYWVRQTPKTVKIEWVEKLNSDGSELDQNVRWEKEFSVKKDNKGKHCYKILYDTSKNILIYPFRNGQPFFLEPANIEHINKEIKSCEEWGVSSQYYKELETFL